MKGAKVAILAVFKPDVMKIYVVPVRHLLNAAVILLPFNGKYAMGCWIAVENGWDDDDEPFQNVLADGNALNDFLSSKFSLSTERAAYQKLLNPTVQ